MGDRIIEVSGFDAYLSASRRQIAVKRDGEVVGRFPAEDVGLLVVDTPLASFSNETLLALVEGGGMAILCGPDHLPAAWVLPVAGNQLQVRRMEQQIALTRPRRKRLWQQVVQAKIRNQAAVCEDAETARALRAMAARVGSGDPGNVEAQAARLHWSRFLHDEPGFRRDREGPAPNHLLNYGYAILRAAMARTLCGAGLHPSLGLHHCNRSAGFPLADDLMEPFRPWADRAARRLHRRGVREIDRPAKAAMLGLLAERCRCGANRTSLDNAMARLVNSLVRHLEEPAEKLDTPGWP